MSWLSVVSSGDGCALLSQAAVPFPEPPWVVDIGWPFPSPGLGQKRKPDTSEAPGRGILPSWRGRIFSWARLYSEPGTVRITSTIELLAHLGCHPLRRCMLSIEHLVIQMPPSLGHPAVQTSLSLCLLPALSLLGSYSSQELFPLLPPVLPSCHSPGEALW